MSNTMKNVRALAANDQLPLETVFLQCYDTEHLSPENNYDAWDKCLKEVYSTRNPKPSVTEFGDAMYSVWKDAGLSRAIMIEALKSIPDYADKAIYTEVNKYYPITVLMTVDTVQTLKTGNLSNYITVTDDNGDPNQGSNEITVIAKMGSTLAWKAVSINGTDTVHLKQFIKVAGPHLFTTGEPSLQPDGTFQGTLTTTGLETYRFSMTINNGTTVYSWDPYIQSN